MRRFLFTLFAFIIGIGISKALDVPVFLNISSNCIEVDDNEAIIPINVVAIKSGDLVTLVDNYKLGLIDNSGDYDISIENVEGFNKVDIVYVDGIIDDNKQSSVYYKLKKNIHLKEGDSLIKFDLVYTFKSNVPNKLFVLGKEIAISDEIVCNIVNDKDYEVVRVDEIEKYSGYFWYIIVILLFIICILGTVIILKNRKK